MATRPLSRTLSLAAFAALSSLSLASRADEPFPARAERMLAPGRSTAADDSVESLVLNPASLAYLPAPELRWTGMNCRGTERLGCGHALSVGTPLFAGLATGLRLDILRPPEGTSAGIVAPYNWITWGLSLRASDRLSFGATLQGSFSADSRTDKLFGVSLAANYRPNPYLAFALVGHDLNGPSGVRLGPYNGTVLGRSGTLAMALRPTGTRQLEIGLEARYVDGPNQLRPRLTVGVDLPGLGRARGDLEIANPMNDHHDRSYTATLGLEVALGHVSAGAGVGFGNGFGAHDSFTQYGTASLTLFRQPGVNRAARGVYIRLEKTPGARAHTRLLRALWRLAEAPDVKVVGLVLKAEPTASLAHAEELADALRYLRAHGKKTMCGIEDGGARALYVCANADRAVLNPGGFLRYSGLRSQHIYLAGLLEKIGVKAEFVRIGAHKAAPEMFTERKPTPVALADQQRLLANVEAVFVKNLATYRRLDPAEVRAQTAKGPFSPSEAKAAGFLDGSAYDDEYGQIASELAGGKLAWQPYEPSVNAPERFGGRGKVALLMLDGDIVDGRSQVVPLLGNRLVGSYSMAEEIKRLRGDRDVKAVVLRIESPGGSALASEVMWRELSLLAKQKPLIVSMGAIAASGGYYVASAGRTVYALPLTLTGSIGIYFGKADVSGLLERVGVHVETQRTTPRADATSMFRGFTDEERRELLARLGVSYNLFVDRVAQGRKLTHEQVDAVGQGQVWYGQEAKVHGLVDQLGGLREALAQARREGGLPDDAPLVERPVERSSLVDLALRMAGLRAMSQVASLPAPVRELGRTLAPAFTYEPSTPVARLDWVEPEPAEEDDRWLAEP